MCFVNVAVAGGSLLPTTTTTAKVPGTASLLAFIDFSGVCSLGLAVAKICVVVSLILCLFVCLFVGFFVAAPNKIATGYYPRHGSCTCCKSRLLQCHVSVMETQNGRRDSNVRM